MAGDGRWAGGYSPNMGKLERCILGDAEIQVPECFLEQVLKNTMTQVFCLLTAISDALKNIILEND